MGFGTHLILDNSELRTSMGRSAKARTGGIVNETIRTPKKRVDSEIPKDYISK
jgi:hypothetical protein